MSIQRYRYRSVSAENLKQYTKSGGNVVDMSVFYVDINLNSDDDKEDLDAYMGSIGYEFVESNPQMPIP